MNDILIVDDEKDIRELISDILRDEGYETRLAWHADSAFEEINTKPPALIILDIWLKDSDMDGIDVLKQVKRDNPDIPVVIISGHGNIEIAVAAVKQGAYDFIEKPFNIDQLLVVIARALEASRLRGELSALKRTDIARTKMVGHSQNFKTLQSQLDRVADTNSRVLLSGPPGSGKEIAARYIHLNSARADRPFISVSSASVVPEAMEEQLFGIEGGAGILKPGLLEQAHGGALFFDEVADMPLGTQAKILRVLVDQDFTRMGGSNKVRVDVRILSASNRNLENEISAGRFREDLYHRLNVVPIKVPSLEKRSEDIPELCEYFVEELSESQSLPKRRFSERAASALQSRSWPGNIRQLKNLVEKLLILGPKQGDITYEEVFGGDPENGTGGGLGSEFIPTVTALPLREAREAFEREYLAAQMNRFNGNISRTAAFVGMERSALHRKLKLLGVLSGGSE